MSAETPQTKPRRVISLDVCVKALVVAVSAAVWDRVGTGAGAVTAVGGLLLSEGVAWVVTRLKLREKPVLLLTALVSVFDRTEAALGSVGIVKTITSGPALLLPAATTVAATGAAAVVVAAPVVVGQPPLVGGGTGDPPVHEVELAAGRTTVVPFEGEEGRRALVRLGGFGEAKFEGLNVSVHDPAGTELAAKELRRQDPLLELGDEQRLSDGHHEVRIVPNAGAGTLNAEVFVIPADVTGELELGEEAATLGLETTTPGQGALVAVGGEGPAWLRVSGLEAGLFLNGLRVPAPEASVTLLREDDEVRIDPARDLYGPLTLELAPTAAVELELENGALSSTEAPADTTLEVVLVSLQAGTAFLRLGNVVKQVEVAAGRNDPVSIAGAGAETLEGVLVAPTPLEAGVVVTAEVLIPGQWVQYIYQGPIKLEFSATLGGVQVNGVPITSGDCVQVDESVVTLAPTGTGTGTMTITTPC